MQPRAELLHALTTRTFDLLVIGGGITGAGVARDAAMRGLSVALVDKGDFASGTSSRSSRLVHGGVRYLEHGHLHLVFEASAERRRLLKLAPHLVRPQAFTWPVYRGQRLPIWKLAAGLTLYDVLALFRNVHGHRRLRAADVLKREPRLNPDQLLGGVRYYDATTDDARLTLVNVLDARGRGAVVVNHAVFAGAGPTSDGLRVARVEDALTGTRVEVRARVFVNATGPWSDAVRRLEGEGGSPGTGVQGSKGSHIALPRGRLPIRDALTLLHPRDNRVMFALPAESSAIVGTTDTFTDVSPDDVRATTADVRYLLEAANHFFPDARLGESDVTSAWAGIRPLIPSGGSSVQASREHAIARDDGSVTITGGKLTTYRVMARQVVDAAQEALGRPVARAATGRTVLPGGDLANDQVALARSGPRDEWNAHALRSYGSAATDVSALCRATRDGESALVTGLAYRMGELRWAVEQEMAYTLGDLLIRRLHVAYETRDNGRAAARRAAEFVGPLFGWDAAARERELARYDAEVARIFTIEP